MCIFLLEQTVEQLVKLLFKVLRQRKVVRHFKQWLSLGRVNKYKYLYVPKM